MAIRVLLVDDQALFREGLATLLSVYEEIDVVAQASNGEEAIAAVEDYTPHVVLMDLHMPVLNGVAATRAILANHRHTKIIVLTTFDDEEYLFDALRAGAAGYLLKDVPSAKLVEAIRGVARGDSFLQPALTSKLLAEYHRLANGNAPGADKPITGETRPHTAGDPLLEPLSPRELEILQEVAAGKANKEIADALCIAEGTVKNHMSNILSKLGVASRTAAVAKARSLQWL